MFYAGEVLMVRKQEILNAPVSKVKPQEQELIDVLESMSDAFVILDKDFKFVRANKMYEQLSGVKIKDSLGKSIWQVFPHIKTPDSPYWTHYHDVVNTKNPTCFIVENSFHIWTEINAYPTSSGGIIIFVRDITGKVKAEEALQESERRFRALVGASSDVLYRMSPDWSEMHQLDGRNFLADTGNADPDWIDKYIPKDEQSHVKGAIKNAIANKITFQLEHRVNQADGSIGWTYSRAIPIMDDDGTIIEWFGAATDITERRNQFETSQRMQLLTEQRNALIKVNQTKDEFIALASHQLRTPATAVKQYIGMMLGDFTGPLNDQQRKFLQTAYDSNERELRIINDLLRTAQIDSAIPSSDMSAEVCDIIELTQEVINDLLTTVDRRGQMINLTTGEKTVYVRMDVTEMKLALSNLVENASKYSGLGTEIIVDISTNDNTVRIAVIDQGVGISTQDQERVYEKFTRIHNELSEKTSGTGLGLYWVKQIAEMHGGSIELKSKPGKGSTFTLKLPISTESPSSSKD